MASRKEQKEAARQRRLAEEQAAQARAQRTRRMQMLGGVLVAVIAAIVVVVIVSTSGGNKDAPVNINNTHATSSISRTVNASLQGIPQHGNVIGNPKAPVTLIEYGDLECPACQYFALNAETQLIANQVKQGKVKLEYRSFPTATKDEKNWEQIFFLQQDAAYAAGAQNKAWNYILLFYHEQGTEGSNYVNTNYLTKLARQIPGLNVTKWASDRFNPAYENQIQSDVKQATNLRLGATPGIQLIGPKSQTQLYGGALSYQEVNTLIKQVS